MIRLAFLLAMVNGRTVVTGLRKVCDATCEVAVGGRCEPRRVR